MPSGKHVAGNMLIFQHHSIPDMLPLQWYFTVAKVSQEGDLSYTFQQPVCICWLHHPKSQQWSLTGTAVLVMVAIAGHNQYRKQLQ